MRILLAAKYVPTGKRPIGGVQSWIKTVRADLERRGHECHEWETGMPLRGTFDLGIIANLSYTRPVLNFCRRSILFSHGVIKDERPQAGCDVYAFVSEEVRDHWNFKGPVIRQPIDMDFWTPDKRGNQLVRHSYRNSATVSPAVAKAIGMSYRQVAGMTHEKARDCVSRAAVVHATGRAALEAMSCDVPTVIYDHRQAYQPPYLGAWGLARETNYSGRRGVARPTLEMVKQATEEAMQRGGWRDWVAAHHSASRIVSEILCSVS